MVIQFDEIDRNILSAALSLYAAELTKSQIVACAVTGGKRVKCEYMDHLSALFTRLIKAT